MSTAVSELHVNYDDDDSWADAPLTPEEEEGLRTGRENAKKGDYLTLAEFRESQKCGQ